MFPCFCSLIDTATSDVNKLRHYKRLNICLQWKVHLAYPASSRQLHSNNQKQIIQIQIQHNRIKNFNGQEATSWQNGRGFKSGRKRPNSACGQNGTRTWDRQIANPKRLSLNQAALLYDLQTYRLLHKLLLKRLTNDLFQILKGFCQKRWIRSYKIFARLSMERFLKRYVSKSSETRVRFKVMFLDMSQGGGEGGLTSYLKWRGWGDSYLSIQFFSFLRRKQEEWLICSPDPTAPPSAKV